jgi:ATP-binding cassette subfamily C protein
LAVVGLVTILQGIVATVGVVSIFPFLALATDPGVVRQSEYGQKILGYLPQISDQTLLLVAGIGAAGMLLVANSVHLLTVYLTVRYTRGFGQWLRVRLLQQITSQEYAYFLSHSSGVLMKKVNSDTQIFINLVLMPLLQTVSAVLNILLLSVALIWFNPWVSITAGLSLGIAYLGIYQLLAGHRQRFSHVMLETSRNTSRLVHQLLSAIKPIKVHGVESTFVEKFQQMIKKAAIYEARQTVFQIAPKNLVEPIALSVLITIVVSYAYIGQDMAQVLPTLGLMAMAAYRLLPNIQSIYGSMTSYSSNLHALDEVYEEFNRPQTAPIQTKSARNPIPRMELTQKIELSDVSFRYPTSATNVIDSLNLEVPANTSLALVGTTGCGKSTLVDLILGLHAPTDGAIRIDGVHLGRENRRNWLASIGYVPQDIVLLDDSVAANIALGVDITAIDWSRMKVACEAAQILDFVETELPNGWQTEVGERGVRLSGGQRQRIGIARALYHSPSLLILDEATSALDNETEASVMEAIMRLEGKITMIIIAHRLTTIQWCDQIFDMTKASIHSPSNVNS